MRNEQGTEHALTPDAFDHDGTDLIDPQDRPVGVEEFGVTSAEGRRGDSLEQRDLRLEPEVDADSFTLADGSSAAIPAEEAALHVTDQP